MMYIKPLARIVHSRLQGEIYTPIEIRSLFVSLVLLYLDISLPIIVSLPSPRKYKEKVIIYPHSTCAVCSFLSRWKCCNIWTCIMPCSALELSGQHANFTGASNHSIFLCSFKTKRKKKTSLRDHRCL